MNAPHIELLFDFISPYAYLAWTQLHALAERTGATAEAKPILFAALLNAHGQKGPAEIPHKRLYVLKDAYRKAHALGVPIAVPATHPFNPLAALRLAAIAPERRLIDALYRATWAEGRRVDQADVVAQIAREVGLDEATIARGQGEEAKQRLRANTDQALAAGAFGVPTMLAFRDGRAGRERREDARGELFWGVDSLPDLERHLRGEDPVPHDAIARWAHLPASASRT